MNIASIQAFAGVTQKTSVNGAQGSNATSGMAFGSVYNSLVTENVTVQANTPDEISNEAIMAIFNASTVEELAEAIPINKSGIPEILAKLLGKTEVLESAYQNDFWSVLDLIDNETPQFFNNLSDSLLGKGAIPKEQAIELLALLKSATLTAPTTDLLMKQEQQIFSLQSLLGIAGEQFEKVLHSTGNARPGILPLSEIQHGFRFVIQMDTGQSATDDESTKDSTKEGTKELAQQAVNSAVGNSGATKNEITVNNLENRNNTRNETLMREMQTIFKRSSFGQAGGTNRLLIKLNPEHLGQLRIELLQTNGVMTARILASTALGKEMLDSQLNQLRSAFIQQNLQVERIDISQTLQDTSRSDRGQQSFDQQFKKEQQGSNEQNDQPQEDEMTFQDYMIELEV